MGESNKQLIETIVCKPLLVILCANVLRGLSVLGKRWAIHNIRDRPLRQQPGIQL